MSFIEAIILGIIQGLTEFLPVSSSGHIEIGKVLLGVDVKDNLIFSVVVHGATSLSTIIIFRKEIWEIVSGVIKFKWNQETQYALKVVISMVPVFIFYKLFNDQIDVLFNGQLLLVGGMLIVTGILLTFTYFKKSGIKEVNYIDSLVIGISQAIAILPGISRSGATISTALLLGVDKEKATKFSFLMVLAPIVGGNLLKLTDYFETPVGEKTISSLALLIGFLAAFLSGLFACTQMIKIVKKGKLIYFAYYCFIIGLVTVIFTLLNG